jgi:DNA invertase Pin-like site-specific DNA recombinase
MKLDQTPVFNAVPAAGPETKSCALARPKLAIGYVRVAACTQADPRHGLDAQTATIRALAKAGGIELVRVFEDAGESAHNASRPGLLALLAAAEARLAGVIIVPDLSRLARDAGDLHRLLDLLDRRGVRLLSATDSRGGGV